MKLSDIYDIWKSDTINKKANIDLWNSMADSFNNFQMPTSKTSNFIKLVLENKMIEENFYVLDVGCGSGKYSIALADKCKKIIGIDLSPKMIENANKQKAKYQVDNAEFYCEDWSNINVKEAGFEKQFDLVFAHMTPAICDAKTFLKLSECSKKYCVLCKPTRRTDPVSDKVKSLVGIKETEDPRDMSITYAFDILWLEGYEPKVKYEKQVWQMEKTLDEAYGLYINRVKAIKDITLEEEQTIKNYLQSIAIDGKVYETVNTTITTIYWQV